MVGKRQSTPDGLIAARLYVRTGKRTTAFWYKHADNRTEIFASAPTCRPDRLADAKAQALRKWADLRAAALPAQPAAPGAPAPLDDASLAGLFARYFAWQQALPRTSTLRKADSTIASNKREKTPLLAVFGAMAPLALRTQHVYGYIDARSQQGAPAGCMKEVALLSAVLAYGIRIGRLEANPCHGVRAEKRPPNTRLVTWQEIEHATQVGRKAGGTAHVQALALRAAWLAFKRPSEVLRVPKSAAGAEGLLFEASKRRRAQGRAQILIQWSPELKATIDEALALQRWAAFGGGKLIFGNLAGQTYSKSGWGTLLARFMDRCEEAAAKEGIEFQRFTLADCRPGGITAKKRAGHLDTSDGAGHSDARMVDQVYDRRTVKTSTPAR
jgi:integrase